MACWIDATAIMVTGKGVVGLPGEWIQARRGHVQICTGPAGKGCKTLHELYISSKQASFGPIHVPVGGYFIMGDNREFSDDSRRTGSIRPSQFVGRYIKTLQS